MDRPGAAPAMKVLFFSPFGHWTVHNQVDGLLARALTLRGAETLVLRCNSLYQACLGGAVPQNCAYCVADGDRQFGEFQVPQRFLNDFVQAGDADRIRAWAAALPRDPVPNASFEGLPLGSWVESTIRTAHRDEFGGPWSDAVIDEFRDEMVKTYVTYRAMERALDWFKPDFMVLFNGRFYPYRAAMEAARAKNIDFFCHERGVLQSTWQFYDRDNCETHAAWGESFAIHGSTPLTADQIERVDALLSQRSLGTRNWISCEPKQASTVATEFRLGLPPASKVIGVFTSSADEMNLRYQRPETSQILLIENLFKLLGDRDVTVVIRHHPNLTGMGLRKPSTWLLGILLEQKKRAPANFRIVMPEENVSSFDILPFL